MKINVNSSFIELIIDAISASIFTLSFSGAFFVFRGLDISVWHLLWLSLAQSMLLLVFSRRWYLLPLVMLFSALTGYFLLWRLEAIDLFISGIVEFWQQLALFLRIGETAGLNELAAASLLMFPIACFFFIMLRKISSLIIYGIIIGMAYIPLLIWYSDTFTFFLVSIAGLLLLIPRHFSLSLARKRPHDTTLPRGPMQLLAIPVVILSIILANVIVPENTRDWRWAPLVNRIADFQDLWHNSLGSARSWQAFSLADYGYAPSGQRLGGPVTLSDKTILRVRSDQNVLLRGIARDIYTGYSWERSAMQNYRFESTLWRLIRRRAFDYDLPPGSAGKDFLLRFGKDLTMEIEPVSRSSTLFYSGRVNSINMDDKLNHPPYFSENGDLFVYNSLPQFSSYTIDSTWYDRGSESFTREISNLEQTMDVTDHNWTKISEMYLQLPDGLPDIVSSAANTAAGSGETPYSRAALLEKYLRDNFSYSLSPDMPPENEDFVAHFLETGSGYCVYFATAMVVMARSLGIPARYVEGFTLESTYGDSRWIATGENAHSWAELYFYGIGWLTFDPTPASRPADPIDPDNGANLTPTPAISRGPDPDLPGEDTDPGRAANTRAWIIALALLAVLIITGRLLVFTARYRHRKKFLPEYIRRRIPGAAARLEFYYRDIMRQMACIDVLPEKGETMHDFAVRADKHLRFTDHSVPDAFIPVSNWYYGDIPPGEDDIAVLYRLHKRLEERLQDSMARTAYFWKRVVR